MKHLILPALLLALLPSLVSAANYTCPIHPGKIICKNGQPEMKLDPRNGEEWNLRMHGPFLPACDSSNEGQGWELFLNEATVTKNEETGRWVTECQYLDYSTIEWDVRYSSDKFVNIPQGEDQQNAWKQTGPTSWECQHPSHGEAACPLKKA